MVRPTGPGVYTATYSNVWPLKLLLAHSQLKSPTDLIQVPVYEYQFGEGLKEHGK